MTVGSRPRLARCGVALRGLGRSISVELRSRPLHAGLGALVVGLACGPRIPAAAVGLAVAVATSTAWCALRRRGWLGGRQPGPDLDGEHAVAPAALAAVLIVAVLAGAGVGAARVAALERTQLDPGPGRSVTERVVVEHPPRSSRFGGWSGLVALRGEPVLLRVEETTGDRPPAVGALLDVTGRLKASGEWARLRRAHAELAAFRIVPAGRRGGVAGALDRVRTRAEEALDRGLPPTAAALLRGMVLGQDDALPDETRDAFRAAGLSHLVAASGTNVVLLAALAMGLGTALGLGLSGRLWLVLVLIAVYVPLAGGGASIQRAGIMGAAAVAAGLVGRPASRWYALGLAAAVTLVLDPRAVEEPGWQLSFVAVVSLLVLAPRWRRALTAHGVPRALAEVLAMTAAATLSTAPVVAAHFGQASLVAIPANLLAAPAVAPVMWLGVVAAALGQPAAPGGLLDGLLGGVVEGLDAMAGFPLGYLLWVGTTAARAPGAVLETGPWVVAAVSVALGVVASSARARRVAPPLAVVGVAALVAVSAPAVAPAGVPPGLRITFLDVGQGDATLLQDGHRAVLVDAGLPEAGILGLLERAGVARLDLFVATHASADHEGGAAAVVAGLPVAAILDGRGGVASAGLDAMEAAARARGVELVAARAGQRLTVGGLRLRVLWPHPEPAARHAGVDPNERAVVLEVEAHGARALLTADAESGVLSRLALRPVDVLKVAHHGSEDPGLPAVLARLRPRVAGIEVGAENTYGHPAPSTLRALEGVPIVVRTDRDGTVRLDLRSDGRWDIRAHA